MTALNDVKNKLESRLKQCTEYEGSFERLLQWLNNYNLKATLEEKKEQLEKYQVRTLLNDYLHGSISHYCRISPEMTRFMKQNKSKYRG